VVAEVVVHFVVVVEVQVVIVHQDTAHVHHKEQV
jgi:hypothetical protein